VTRGSGALPKSTKLGVLCLLLASVLAMLAPLLVGKITRDKANAVWNERQVQASLQREVIADYQLQTNLVEQVFADLQNQLLDKDLDETALQALIQQSNLTMQAFDTMVRTLNSATYLAEDAIVFLQDLQAQMQAMGVEQGVGAGKESRASNYENHWLTQKIVFVTVTYGYHLSPDTCRKLYALCMVGDFTIGAIAVILDFLKSSATPIAAAAAIALQIALYLVTLDYAARNKGVDGYFPLIGTLIPAK